MDVQYIAKTIGVPVEQWPGNCHGIAALLVEHRIVPGRVARGHWLGSIAPDSHFDALRGIGFVQHSWIQTRDYRVMPVQDRPAFGSDYASVSVLVDPIVDPTRYVFEGVEPYIYVGSRTDASYDEGGNGLRSSFMGNPPPYSAGEKELTVKLYGKAGYWLAKLTDFRYPPGVMTVNLAFWIANFPPRQMDGHAAEIYRALTDAGHRGFIPLDNYRAVMATETAETV